MRSLVIIQYKFLLASISLPQLWVEVDCKPLNYVWILRFKLILKFQKKRLYFVKWWNAKHSFWSPLKFTKKYIVQVNHCGNFAVNSGKQRPPPCDGITTSIDDLNPFCIWNSIMISFIRLIRIAWRKRTTKIFLLVLYSKSNIVCNVQTHVYISVDVRCRLLCETFPMYHIETPRLFISLPYLIWECIICKFSVDLSKNATNYGMFMGCNAQNKVRGLSYTGGAGGGGLICILHRNILIMKSYTRVTRMSIWNGTTSFAGKRFKGLWQSSIDELNVVSLLGNREAVDRLTYVRPRSILSNPRLIYPTTKINLNIDDQLELSFNLWLFLLVNGAGSIWLSHRHCIISTVVFVYLLPVSCCVSVDLFPTYPDL